MRKRKVTNIASLRKLVRAHSFIIMYEWEDIVAEKTGLPINIEGIWKYKYFRRFEKNNLEWLYQKLLPSGDLKLRFLMGAHSEPLCVVNKNTIPVIIDFWMEDNELSDFYNGYKDCPLVLVTSAEVVEFLRKKNCPLPIEHWPLSYPDQYRMDLNTIQNKEYEFCIFGRPNPFFIRMLDRYCEIHLDFTYIQNNGNIDHRQYVNHKGEVIAEDTGRQSYLDMIRKTKISCYTTPGIDESKKETGRFNQVTPRLFEMLTNGCSVIGHYSDNADTRYYKLNDIVPNVNSYEDFERTLDLLRSKPLDFDYIAGYMKKHYTSTRVEMLLQILKRYNIEI